MTIPTSSVPAVVGSEEGYSTVRELVPRLSRWTQNRCQLKIEAWIFQFIPIQVVTAGQSPPRVEFSLEHPPRSLVNVPSVCPPCGQRNVDCSYGLWRYWRQSDNHRLSFTSLRLLQAPSSQNILRISRNPSRISCHGSASIICVTCRGQS